MCDSPPNYTSYLKYGRKTKRKQKHKTTAPCVLCRIKSELEKKNLKVQHLKMGHSAVSAGKPLLFPDDQTNQLKGALPKVFSELSEPYNFLFSGEKKNVYQFNLYKKL